MKLKSQNAQYFGSAQPHRNAPQLSSELYRDFSEHMDMPIDSDMPLEVRYELYISKVVYLKNLLAQCFQSVNKQFSGAKAEFSSEDFANIQNSFLVTKDLIRDCILKKYTISLDRNARRFFNNQPDSSIGQNR
jgi:hypothetical protein